ncbi:spherulation-specific family 4 protein [Streptomyces sp. NPDC092296]|uniref:spherulation-specific family 4 protein n=1 Tax=Streptomyces sp. NPDC092296 TaxID=3366012 RepID=UPI00380D8601
MYVHPAVDGEAWRALVRCADRLYGVVLNAADGPGDAPDHVLAAAAEELRGAGVRVLGYVDTGYGSRPHSAAVQDLVRYRDWYRTDGVYFDQAATEPELLPYHRRLTVAARALGAATVVLGHGTHPDPGYADPDLGDLLVTFEGDWAAYQEAGVPRWTADHPPARFCHLVHGVPAGHGGLVARTSRLRGAGVHCAVPGSGANPWQSPPDSLRPGVPVPLGADR